MNYISLENAHLTSNGIVSFNMPDDVRANEQERDDNLLSEEETEEKISEGDTSDDDYEQSIANE